MVELVLMAPWIFFLFIGVLDFGFYAYAAICIQNAARAAAMQTASSVGVQSNVVACNAALQEMNFVANIGSAVTSCDALPLIVTRRTLCTQGTVVPSSLTCETPCITQANPACADCSSDPAAASSQVCVTYQSGLFVPVPAVLTNQLTLTRAAEMRIIAE
jgi:TadE-like protein